MHTIRATRATARKNSLSKEMYFNPSVSSKSMKIGKRTLKTEEILRNTRTTLSILILKGCISLILIVDLHIRQVLILIANNSIASTWNIETLNPKNDITLERILTTRLSRNNPQQTSNVSCLANILKNSPISGWVVIGLEPKVRQCGEPIAA